MHFVEMIFCNITSLAIFNSFVLSFKHPSLPAKYLGKPFTTHLKLDLLYLSLFHFNDLVSIEFKRIDPVLSCLSALSRSCISGTGAIITLKLLTVPTLVSPLSSEN